jgi:peptidoglycan-N-acetylglucosamine deacetylase
MYETQSPAAASRIHRPSLSVKFRAQLLSSQKFVRNRVHTWIEGRIAAISNVTTEERIAALTFDDGPNATFTPRLLEVLAKHNARATFFMVGTMARRNPELVRQVAEQGHAIGNHTFEHPSIPLISRGERWRQIRSCSRALAPHEQKLFRPPFGQCSLSSCIDATILGYSVIGWNAHAFDWLGHDAEWMANHLKTNLQSGSIITLHDALYNTVEERHSDRSRTIRAVDLFLQQIGSEYRFVTVPELLGRGRARRWVGFAPVNRDFHKALKPNDGPVYSYGFEA